MMRQFEAWGQTDVTFGDLTDTTFGNLLDAGLTLDGSASVTTQDNLGSGTGVAVTYNAATVTMDGDTVTFGYTAVPVVASLDQQVSATRQAGLLAPLVFTSYDGLLVDLAAAAQVAADDEEPSHVTRSLERGYQQTLHMQTDERPLNDWLRIAGALVITAALHDADRERAEERMAVQHDIQAREWAANALEEAGA